MLGTLVPALGGGDARRSLALASRRHRTGDSFHEAIDPPGIGHIGLSCVAGSHLHLEQIMNPMPHNMVRRKNPRNAWLDRHRALMLEMAGGLRQMLPVRGLLQEQMDL